jgi:DNA-binding NarL/FixJ family response regulator
MNRARAVIAEDHVLIQEMIRCEVEQDCDVVAAVEDGPAALASVEAYHPDLLLVDVSLPVIGGFAIAQRLRVTDPAVRILFITAHSDPSYVDRAFELGVMAYVAKAMIRLELRSAVRAVLAGNQFRSAILRQMHPAQRTA